MLIYKKGDLMTKTYKAEIGCADCAAKMEEAIGKLDGAMAYLKADGEPLALAAREILSRAGGGK